MIAKREKDGWKYVCRRCKYVITEKHGGSTLIPEKIRHEEEKILVMEAEDEFKEYPKTKATCPKCGNDEAYWYLQQTRGGDEPQTKFLCCTKCKYKWREY